MHDFLPKSYLSKFCWIFLSSLYLYYFYFICVYAVDLPYWDEWDFLKPSALSADLSLRWLFEFHNEHRIVFTKLIAWVLLRIDGWNIAHQQILNYLIFGGLLTIVVYIKKIAIGFSRFSLFPAFLIFLLSPIAFKNHSWGFENQFHFVLIFSFLSAAYAFAPGFNPKNLILFWIFAIFSLYSFSAGVLFTLIYLICFLIFMSSDSFKNGFDKKRLIYSISTFFVLTGALFSWFKGYSYPSWHPLLVWPRTMKFWNFFLNLISFGFGYQSVNYLIGLVCLFIIFMPILGLLLNKVTRCTCLIISVNLAILAALAAITMGRAGFGISWSKNDQYSEVAFMLIPYTALAWWLFLKPLPKLIRSFLLCLLWVFCFIGYADNWSINVYQEVNRYRKADFDCLVRYFKGTGDGNCPQLYHSNLSKSLDYAKRLNMSFTRNIK